MSAVIICRAQVHPNCLHGQAARSHYGEDAMRDDGTFDGHSVVCDACYVKLMALTPSGQGLLHELPAAIAKARDDSGKD